MAEKTPEGQLDITANRAASKWSTKAKIGRVLWGMASPFFALSPRLFWGWRRMLLRLFGAKIGKQVHIYPTARITIPWNLTVGDQSAIGDRAIIYALGPITLGKQVTVSQYAHLCAGSHEFRQADVALTKPPIKIEDGAWIATEAFVGPGLTVGAYAVAGARAVVTKDVPPNVIVGGNPAKEIGRRDLQQD